MSAETTWADHVQWERCDRCGGDLPCLLGNNGHPALPNGRHGGECPGYVTGDGNCGAYEGVDLDAWLDEPADWGQR